MFFGQLSQRSTCNPCGLHRGPVQFQTFSFVTLALPQPGEVLRETDLDALLSDFTAPELVEGLDTLHPAGDPSCLVSLVSNACMHLRRAAITSLRAWCSLVVLKFRARRRTSVFNFGRYRLT